MLISEKIKIICFHLPVLILIVMYLKYRFNQKHKYIDFETFVFYGNEFKVTLKCVFCFYSMLYFAMIACVGIEYIIKNI